MRNIFVLWNLILFAVVNLTAGNATTSVVQYPSGKDTVQAYLCVPEGRGPFPAIIVIHEW